MSLATYERDSDERWRRIVSSLRTENDTLREENEQLKAHFALNHVWPRAWKLTAGEGIVLSLLATRPLVSVPAAMTAIYSDRAGPEPKPKIIDVWICHLRRKLKAQHIEIENVWGRGYRLTESTRTYLNALGRSR